MTWKGKAAILIWLKAFVVRNDTAIDAGRGGKNKVGADKVKHTPDRRTYFPGYRGMGATVAAIAFVAIIDCFFLHGRKAARLGETA